MNFPVVQLLLAATASLVPTSSASNLLRELSSSDGDLSALNQLAEGDSPDIEEMGGTSQDSALSMRLDASIQGSPQTNLQDRLLQSSTPLTGYMITAVYNDATCTKLYVANAFILNTCTRFNDMYSKLTATVTDSFYTYYSDKECTKMTSTGPTIPYTSGCNSKMMTSVNSNGDFTSSSALVSRTRYVKSS